MGTHITLAPFEFWKYLAYNPLYRVFAGRFVPHANVLMIPKILVTFYTYNYGPTGKVNRAVSRASVVTKERFPLSA